MNIRALISDPRGGPMLFSFGCPYFPLYHGASYAPWRPRRMRLAISSVIVFLYIISQNRFLRIAPSARGKSVRIILASLSACSIYCDMLMVESVVETPS